MKKIIFVVLACVLLFPVVTIADILINQIQVSYVTGGTANYTSGSGVLDWTGGNYTVFYTTGGAGFYDFQNTVFDFDWDLSSHGGAGNPQANFDLNLTTSAGTITLYDHDWSSTDPAVVISLSMYTGGDNPWGGKYYEEKSGTRALDGSAWVNVYDVWADSDWETDVLNDEPVGWDTDGVAGLDSDVTLDPLEDDILDYTSDYSAPDGLIVTLWANQNQVVPEPMTVALLGLGGLLIRRKK